MKKTALVVIILVLAAISLVSLDSIAPELVIRQAVFFGSGLTLMLLISQTRFQDWKVLSSWIYWLTNLLLLGLLFFGQATRGTVGWITLPFGFKFQPSQFAVTASALFLAFHLKQLNLAKLGDFAQYLVWMLLPAVLILLEPDIGTGLVYLGSMVIPLLAVKIPNKYWVGMIAAGLIGAVLLWNFGLSYQRKQRITSFLGGYQQSKSAASYNARQALIAVGSGELYGRGLGFGVQSHLKFLPERQTDFIFASLAEEWGFIGSCLVVLIYSSLCTYLILLSINLTTKGEQIFVLTITMMFVIQIGINIGMNLGLTPITGITLPLLSYGGSSLMAFLVSLGFVLSLTNYQPQQELKEIR